LEARIVKSPNRDRHLDTAAALDFLEQRLGASDRRRVEEHLGRPCAACRERVRALGEMIESMRADRVGAVPAALHARALSVFVPVEQPSLARQLADAVAELLFDSSSQPLTAAARRSVGEARRLRFKLGAHAIDLELEREGASTMSVRGRLAAADAHLWTITVECGGERRSVRPDANGHFALDRLPFAPLTLTVGDGGERFRLPTLEP
jgi:hypothetical protein